MMEYPLPYWSVFAPNKPFSDYLNYWNRYTQEERIKRVSEEIWKLIQAYQLLVDAINDLELRTLSLEGRMTSAEEEIALLKARMAIAEAGIADMVVKYNALKAATDIVEGRVTVVEGRATVLETRATALETDLSALEGELNQLILDLPTIINVEITQFLSSDELTLRINNLITAGIEFTIHMNTEWVENNLPTFNATGSIKDSGKKVSITECTYESDDTTIPTSKAIYRSLVKYVTDLNMNNIPLKYGNYYLDNPTASWSVTIGTINYKTNGILVMAPDNTNKIRVQSGSFKAIGISNPVLMERYYDITAATWSPWVIISHEFIESTDANAIATSTANPSALVYVPEV